MKKFAFVLITFFTFSLTACTSGDEIIVENPEASANSIQNIRASSEGDRMSNADANGHGNDPGVMSSQNSGN